MTDPNNALDRLRRANLVHTTATFDNEELAAVVDECERRVASERGAAPGRGAGTGETLRPVSVPRQRWRPVLVFSLAFATLVVVVGAVALFVGSDGLVPEPDVVSDEPTTTVAISTIGGVASVDHLEYYSDAERTLEASVFFPAEGHGPWPVVVVYSEFGINAQERDLSRRIADRGAVVFAPVWVYQDGTTQTGSEYLTGVMWDRAACAVGYAQAQAEVYGGDPARTTVVGAAGGEHPATWVALGLADASGCAEPIRFQPTGLVAGKSQWLFQQEGFDPTFVAEDAVGVDTVDRFFNPERWKAAEDLRVYLWSTSGKSNSNEIDDPPAADSWIWSRDPSGAIVEDLTAVDAFADGLITFSDNSRLMHLRMAEAGIDVTRYESDDPGYSLDDTAFESIWQLIAGE
jgi:hypothetical protein